ncbi:hypothetical protein OCGS_1122 [Oceaniovalibus guishaninsula JLT2003]|uniref:VPLPA-CTERM sorting domain-containing protein n=1 Tax=Oceaniovalibus guishaninsula JLT2003 TaxID=1231392 RepID=K2HPF0_9RHOB|nr:VPLPA-CTERM sorting domain-containing protein [Oceaniovalibus guishaninsula]EKE44739.1 hypothetical protein OCGS_1122 [Oceaniovalibus guishaninsula JLT2003]
MKYLILTAALAALSAGAASAATTTLFEDDFDTETGRYNTTLTNWTIVQGSVDLVGCSGTGKCIDVDGSTPRSLPTIIETKTAFTLTSGNTYAIDFLMPVGTQKDPFTVSLGAFSRSYTGYAFPLAETLSFTAGANATAPLRIALNTVGNNNYGPYLTRISLTETMAVPPAVVPLPAAAWLLAGALGALGFVRRKS